MKTISTFAAVGVLAFAAGCGEDEETAATGAATTSTQSVKDTALAAATATKKSVEQALASYTGGDKAAAEEQISEAYVSSYEKVEPSLESVDEELNEKLEEAISKELREAIKAGDDAKVASLGKEVLENLTKAEAALR